MPDRRGARTRFTSRSRSPESVCEIPESVIAITAPAIMIASTEPNTLGQMPRITEAGRTTTIIGTMIMINQKVRSRSTGAISRA